MASYNKRVKLHETALTSEAESTWQHFPFGVEWKLCMFGKDVYKLDLNSITNTWNELESW